MTDDVTGARKGDYLILGTLGAGGMGKVYKVRNTLSDRVEAMKVLLPDLSEQQDLADRFLREIKVLASLHHPNIAELRTALTINNQLVMIMEYVEGATLAARLQQGPIRYADALVYFDQVLAALSCAHAQRIVHRDIKPANIMLAPYGVVKLMDFGIARSGNDHGLTMTGTTLGSVAYMSPEQVRCEPLDGRSDLYSIGVSLYETITGQRPYVSDNNFEVMQAHLQIPATPPLELKPDIPPALSQLILMAMAKDPAHRFQTADALRAALRSVAPALGEPTPIPAMVYGFGAGSDGAADAAHRSAQHSACGYGSPGDGAAGHSSSGYRAAACVGCSVSATGSNDSAFRRGAATFTCECAGTFTGTFTGTSAATIRGRCNGAGERGESPRDLCRAQCARRCGDVDYWWLQRAALVACTFARSFDDCVPESADDCADGRSRTCGGCAGDACERKPHPTMILPQPC